jgi:ubiquitin carboxyl-terminal hydrolase 16
VTSADLEDGLSDVKLLQLEGLRAGIVTQALKDILDHLNERPIYKKTISAQPFVVALERAFRTRISRQQQDAQEFLQVVAERLCGEYHAGHKARRGAQELSASGLQITRLDDKLDEETLVTYEQEGEPTNATADPERTQPSEFPTETDDFEKLTLASMIPIVEEDGFPLEGKMESQIECQTCGFKPKPSVSTFVTLTLNVPQRSSTTLNQCFDGMFKVEVIEDYKCDRCRLEHALTFKQGQLHPTLALEMRAGIESEIEKIQQALDEDPEKPPVDVKLPDLKFAPRRTIKKHMRISLFPKILAIHLSRSIYDANYSTKNMAKVSVPETLPLGSILDQKRYRLLCVVNHKGGHNSGHYETFRRQVVAAPFSTPHSFGTEGAYSQSGSPALSAVASPRLGALNSKRANGLGIKSPLSPQAQTDEAASPSELPSPLHPSPSTSSLSSRSSFSISGSLRRRSRPPTSAPRESSTITTAAATTTNTDGSFSPTVSEAPASSVKLSTNSKIKPSSSSQITKLGKKHKKKNANNKWWRISDDKVKESKTSEVLGMQKEVYLLFYEMIPDDEEDD